ncbi:carbohydrate kinase [Domibacillus indicus]|uniref:carbohydrate kinase family protein n=1 Tax=Domibacillus indicus TaxID=1437523 RepID=UPI00203E2DD5|nr:carbohydrate kinase [Domibacillus indicus]MCM3790915.1 carbohydrate kinase [Domibacillus indicus]
MSTLFSIGEVLIDFIPQQKGLALKDVVSFERAPGGAPANVAAAVSKLGGHSAMLTKLGSDAFGDFLLEKLVEAGVETKHIIRTGEANTALAFVSLREDGERDFSFYRKPCADLLMTADEVDESLFHPGDILHFCSVDLVESPMKHAHIKAIDRAKQRGAFISFDPNVRLPLWEDPNACRETILAFIPKAHLIKISDEELEFITGISEEKAAIASLFTGDVKAVVYTRGAAGASLFVNGTEIQADGFAVQVQDTTGAGDAFIGGFLFQLLQAGANLENVSSLLEQRGEEIVRFANAAGAITTTGKGAISSLPSLQQIENMLNEVDSDTK